MSEPSQSVFLSYASQDAKAAEKICSALRAAGLEVFLDQSGLRGGDAWDHKIRREIYDCALFIPIVSQHTQERLEGYFRREWKLAVERTDDMAEQKHFLLPVVIDSTGDRDAIVPERFRAVQWTRLPAGETSAAFVQRVRSLRERRRSHSDDRRTCNPLLGGWDFKEKADAPFLQSLLRANSLQIASCLFRCASSGRRPVNFIPGHQPGANCMSHAMCVG